MNIGHYFDYLKRIKSELIEIRDHEKIGLCQLYFDFAWCFFRHGCLVSQYNRGHFYKIPEFIRERSFTQRRVSRLIDDYNDREYINVLAKKNEFNAFYKDFVHRKWIYAKDMERENFQSFLDGCSYIFVKPLDDQEGHGISRIAVEEVDVDALFSMYKGTKVVIESAIVQHPSLCLGNVSVNTARLLTVTDTKGNAHVIRAGLRAGVGSAVVDNFTAGGVLYQIDVKTGIIDHKGIQGNNYDVLFHPGTETCMVGFQMPHWKKAVDSVIMAAEMLPQCRFIGWDVAFTKDGIELIEGNHNPGIFTLESLGTPGAYSEVIKVLNS